MPWFQTWPVVIDVSLPVSIVSLVIILAWRLGDTFALPRAHIEAYVHDGEDPGKRVDTLWLLAKITNCAMCLSYQLPVWLMLLYFWHSPIAMLTAIGIIAVCSVITFRLPPWMAVYVGIAGAGAAYIVHGWLLFWRGSPETAVQLLTGWAGAVVLTQLGWAGYTALQTIEPRLPPLPVDENAERSSDTPTKETN